jgi:hypothetical protein
MNEGGRPRIYESEIEMQKVIDEYFEKEKVLTITGLAIYLGFESRQSIYDYEKNGKFSYIIKRARLRVENGYEKRLLHPELSPTGAIFALKNMGWHDNAKTDITTQGDKIESGIPIVTWIDKSKDGSTTE